MLAVIGLLITTIVGAFASSGSVGASFERAQSRAGPPVAIPLGHDYDAVNLLAGSGPTFDLGVTANGVSMTVLAMSWATTRTAARTLVATEATAGGFDIAEANAGHIFRDATGHLAEDSAANRALLQETAQPGNLVSTDANGVATYRQTLSDGTQSWAEVYNGQITNGGVNNVPR